MVKCGLDEVEVAGICVSKHKEPFKLIETKRKEALIDSYNEIMKSDISDKSKLIYIQAFDALNKKEGLGFKFHLDDFDKFYLRYKMEKEREQKNGQM